MFDELNEAQQYQQPEVTQPESPKEQQEESPKEQSLRILRERAEESERRSREYERKLQDLERAIASQQQPQNSQEDDDFDFNDDTYIEGKQFKKYVRSLKNEISKQKKEFEEITRAQMLNNAEMRLKSDFNDFDSVVTPENLEKLKYARPVLYRSIMANQDIYDRGYTAYEFIKNSAVSSAYSDTDKRLEENKSKPRSSANVAPQAGETPLSRIGDYDRRILTKEQKEQIMRNVQRAKEFR
jgi:hypothetical protein